MKVRPPYKLFKNPDSVAKEKKSCKKCVSDSNEINDEDEKMLQNSKLQSPSSPEGEEIKQGLDKNNILKGQIWP